MASKITVHAKNMSGELLTMEVSPDESTESFRVRLAEQVCPEDSSRLVLLDRIRCAPLLEEALTEEALSNLMEELHVMAEEKQEEEEKEKGVDDWGEWKEGDMVEYLVRDPDPLCIHLSKGMGAVYDAYVGKDPFYPIYIQVKEEGDDPVDIPLYEYGFLFDLRKGIFYPSSAWKIETDDMDTYVDFNTRTSYTSIQEMLVEEAKAQESIPARYVERMCRAVNRKWIRILRSMMKFSTKWQRRARRSRKSSAAEETALWKKHYWAAKEKTRPADKY